jgi:HK97 family phage prohead protease
MTHVLDRTARTGLDLCIRSYDFDIRSADGDGLTLEGYAAVFNTPTRIRDHAGDFDEVVLPGAFARSLGERTPVLQWDHGRDPAVGTAPIGDIADLREDERGLFVRARMYNHASTDRVRMAIKGRSIKGMSFRFGVPDKGDTWTKRTGEPDLREIRDADVHELGPVVFPAYKTTSVGLRHLLADLTPDERRDLIRELAAELRAIPDLTDLVGQPGARSSGGDEATGTEPGNGAAPTPHLRQRLDEGALRARGILT